MQVHGKDADVAQAPCRVALNLAGVQVADVARGNTLSLPELLGAGDSYRC